KMKRYIRKIDAQKEQYSYNFLGLFGFIIRRPIKRKKSFFCSQVASVLKESNVIDFDKPLSLIAPNDLQQVANFRLEYRGKLVDYTNNDNDVKSQCPLQITRVVAGFVKTGMGRRKINEAANKECGHCRR